MNDKEIISSHNIKYTSDENEEEYHLGEYQLIQYKILWTDIVIIVWKTVERIANEILGAEGSKTRGKVKGVSF